MGDLLLLNLVQWEGTQSSFGCGGVCLRGKGMVVREETTLGLGKGGGGGGGGWRIGVG